ncbi:MAG: hypothetical protein Q8L78_06205 [Coxiellaceae bacterium]|nr:hypothetical protein [Coxiellaceae bacterium]
MSLLKKITIPVLTIATIATAHADSNIIPQYLPGGSIPTLSLFDVFSPITTFKQSSWWYTVGLIHDQNNQAHSLQAQITSLNLFNHLAGLSQFGFTFTDALGHDDYLWNCYPSPEMLANYALGTLHSINAIDKNFNVSVSSEDGNTKNPFLYVFAHNPTDLHAVGQIGAQYTINASSNGEVGFASNNPELVHYQFEMTFQDERGLVGEGINGYVGGIAANDPLSAQNSWEFAMPKMRLLSWKIVISPTGKTTTQSPVQQTMTFQGNHTDDNIWLDRQLLYKPSVETPANNTLMSSIQTAAKGKSNVGDSQVLYVGTWMAFCFNKAPFKGLCGDAVAFWNNNTATNLMDSDTNAHGGFMNIFTPDSNGAGFPIQVGSTQTEELSMSDAQKDLPYRIENDPNSIFTSPISHHQYAQTVMVTIRKNTAFSALFDQVSHTLNNDRDYVLKFTALSSLTENVPADTSAGFYEGAAKVYLCDNDGDTCSPIGTGFMEEMGY